MADPKKMAAMIIAAKPKAEGEEAGPIDMAQEGLTSAAHDIIAAINSSDAGLLADALKAFVSMCGESGEEY